MTNQSSAPWTTLRDTLLMGGASVLVFIVIRSTHIEWSDGLFLAGAMMIAAHFVNHPHFVHSYQLFYGQLKTISEGAPTQMDRFRIWWAAYLAPVLLATMLLAAALSWQNGVTLPMGILINAMGALVGWHYVKQGFGMVMTDAALKKAYWSPKVRRWLLANAYLCWILTWTYLNTSSVGTQFWGIFFHRLSLPFELVLVLATCTLASTLWVAVLVSRDLRKYLAAGVPIGLLPWAGLVGYTVSLYLWTIFATADPVFLLVIPFFHSLQYLAIVYRCKFNEIKVGAGKIQIAWSLLRFFGFGILMGALFFWIVPGFIDFQDVRLTWTEVPKPALAIAAFWIFINVHHYFIDNVIWRASNPYVKNYLFK